MNLGQIQTTPFIEEVVTQNINLNLIRYNLFMKYLMKQDNFPESAGLASQIFQASKSVPAGALAAVFSDPAFSHWVYLATCIQQRLENKEAVPVSDLPYLALVPAGSGLDPLKVHLLEVNRFLLAASMLARQPFTAQVLLLEDTVYLPILGFAIRVALQSVICDVVLSMEDGRLNIRFGNQPPISIQQLVDDAEKGGSKGERRNDWILQGTLLGSGGKIVVDHLDPYIRSGWSMLYKNPDGSTYEQISYDEMREEFSAIAEGFREIQSHWPEMAGLVSTAIRTFHMVKSPLPDRHMSCTSDQFFGAILMSTGGKFQLAEAMVHEYSHNLLNVIIRSGDIFEGKVPDEEIYYSPWREDARHISGVLHAVFVFTNVSQLLERLSTAYPEDEYLHERKLGNLTRLRMGMEVLNAYPFTQPVAKALLQDLQKTIGELTECYAGFDFRSSLDVQKAHLKGWINRNGTAHLPSSLADFT